MKIRFSWLISLAMALLGSSTVLVAQTPAEPDLSGIWIRVGRGMQTPFSDGAPPLQPAAKAIYDENRAGLERVTGSGLDEMDPAIYCLPHGMTRAMAMNYPIDIVQTARVVYMLLTAQSMQRRIYLGGRTKPEGFPPTFMGYSSGRYDGETLVVETAGFNDWTWLDTSGVPHSDALHVTEHIRRTGPETMEIAFRFEDSKAFTRAWEASLRYELQPPDFEILEHTGDCEDRFLYNYKNKVFRGTARWQSPEQAAGGR